MTRGGRAKTRDEPERRCIVSGESGGRRGLIRFVIGPDGDVIPDLAGKLPGRGIWVTADRGSLETSVRKKLFARAARQQVAVPEGLPDLIEAGLAKRVIELISLARKAGDAVAGFEKVKGWLATGEAKILIQAEDGSARGRTKLRPPGGQETLISVLNARELGLAFGREHVIHGALAAGGLSTRVVEDAARLGGLRKTKGGKAAQKDDRT